MKKILSLISVLCVLAIFSACSQIQGNNPAETAVEQSVVDSFNQMFPTAVDVVWEADGSNWVASFYLSDDQPATKSKGGNGRGHHHHAWYDHCGNWQMTEVEQALEELPEPVQTAFAESDYASWTVEGASSIERNDIILLYLIEAMEYADSIVVDSLLVDDSYVQTSDTVSYAVTKADLYYSETGYLVKAVVDSIANRPSDHGHHTGSTVPSEADSTGVTCFYDRHGNLTKTYTVVDVLPEAVEATLAEYFESCDTFSVKSAVLVEWTYGETYYKVGVDYQYTYTTHGHGHGYYYSNHGWWNGDEDENEDDEEKNDKGGKQVTVSDSVVLRIYENGRLR